MSLIVVLCNNTTIYTILCNNEVDHSMSDREDCVQWRARVFSGLGVSVLPPDG